MVSQGCWVEKERMGCASMHSQCCCGKRSCRERGLCSGIGGEHNLGKVVPASVAPMSAKGVGTTSQKWVRQLWSKATRKQCHPGIRIWPGSTGCGHGSREEALLEGG